ncbi:MAG: molybdopterin molybdotransferase MoeA [Methanobrevibacter sp.]|uniref:molybdopterin molybdotransferase MoeA n=1 Tax=Methanobrevibacter sp. TaxID=66852 RepID=UPI0026E10328|nr:gephyrin-like molybdotransferase Glp [Methanobrevibacter sp.]MDO5848632.1 molybdopterin molybdotransferase MoeA [Methanobrevibacter sp.]
MFLSKLDSINEAREKIYSHQKVMGSEVVPLKEAHKRVLAEEILSFHDSPPFDKSAMDGFAVKAENTFGASNSAPKTFKIVDMIGAGSESNKTVGENEAIIIATGAPIPDGADAVLMKEYTTTEGDEVTITSQVTPGENVSPKAEDIKKGDVVLPPNTFIRYQEMGLIASAGYGEVKVYEKPRVKLIITGNELVEPTKEDLKPAQIINSNQFTISSMIEDSGAVFSIGRARDTFEDVKIAIEEASKEYDVVMTTGGTALSKGDVVLDVVEDLGEVLLHGVSIRPGKPFGAGIVNDTMVFAFSGQPVAAMSQFDMFARKYLFEMQGRKFDFEIVERVSQLKIPSQLGRTDFIRAVSDDDTAKHVLNRGSGIIRSMVEANSYIIIDENDEGYQKDDIIDVVFFDSMTW